MYHANEDIDNVSCGCIYLLKLSYGTIYSYCILGYNSSYSTLSYDKLI